MSKSSTTIHDGDGVTVISSDDDDDASAVTTGDKAGGTTYMTSSHAAQPGHWTVGVQSDQPIDGASFVAGLMCGGLLLYLFQRWQRSRNAADDLEPVADVSQHDIAALARRTANLERIITDPAMRTASDIDALR